MFRLAAVLLALVTSCSGQSMISEINRMRADPPAYAAKLQARRPYYRGTLLRLPGQIAIQTTEGVRALDQAIRSLKAQRPLPQVRDSPELAKAALLHVRDIGPKGSTSHEGSDGSTSADRIRHQLPHANRVAEVMSFGPGDPASVIVELLVDDGVRDRGHRRILLDPAYRAAGAACGPHKIYRSVCVIDLSDVPATDHAGLPLVPQDAHRRRLQRE